MNKYLESRKSNCKNCYKCIRHCPIKAIRFSDDQAQIVEDECVLCGMCYKVCPQSVKVVRDDKSKVLDLINSDVPVFVSLAPAFIANYNVGITAMKRALMKLGFAGVEETALGASIVKRAYDKLVDSNDRDIIISSCCHSVNTLIQKYYPEALSCLADVKSPMLAHGAKLKSENDGIKVVFIGPCISKKEEAEKYPGDVDAVITFEELDDMLKQKGIEIENCEDECEGFIDRLFPIDSGILKTMKCDNDDFQYISVSGMDDCLAALEDIKQGNIHKCFIEMSSCSGSCVNGPCMSKGKNALVRDTLSVNQYAKKNECDVAEKPLDELKKNISFVGINRQMPGKEQIDEILKTMGKTSPDKELNCGSCGYNTCRDKAIAVFNKKASITMCLPYLLEKAESFSDTIIKNTPNSILVLDEDLIVQQINKSAKVLMNLKSSDDVLGSPVIRILDPTKFLQVLSDGRNIHDEQTYLSDYGKYVELSVMHDKNNRILIVIMRDITDEIIQKQKRDQDSKNTIEITDKVVEKQMRVVQEIASLLGETTAETKVALTKLKESISNDE